MLRIVICHFFCLNDQANFISAKKKKIPCDVYHNDCFKSLLILLLIVLYIHSSKSIKKNLIISWPQGSWRQILSLGHSLTTLTRVWPFLTTYLPRVYICEGISLLIWRKIGYHWHIQYHLPTSSCQRSFWTPPFDKVIYS